jgi:2-polyprenyl-3-methyl-5-hydroxy-6-metoxy-1,4-benzoquinol methylase
MPTDYSRTVEITQCFLCGSDSTMHTHFESVLGEAGEDRYLICKRCGLVFQSPRLSQEDLDAFYASQYRSFVQGSEEPIEKDLKIQHARAQHLLDFTNGKVPRVSTCLDIGSSTGILLKKLKEAYHCEVMGIEPGNAYRTFSRKLGVPATESLEALEQEWQGTFDLITMAHTLEHFPDPVSILKALIERWLSPQGYLLVEVPNLYGHQTLELAHLTAFTSTTLKRVLQKAGFRILEVRTHGKPRSLLIPLYLTALAVADEEENSNHTIHFSSRGVMLRRKLGMFWNRVATKYATRWAWLPWPDLE